MRGTLESTLERMMDPMGMNLEGKRVVVTGGTGALGTAVVGRALEAGASVWVPVHSSGELEGWAHAGHERVTVREDVDLTDAGAVAAFYTEAHGGSAVWASVHCVGGFAGGLIGRADSSVIDTMLAMNVTTTYLCCRECAKAMRGAGKGRIVNVSARVGLVHGAGGAKVAYTAAKAAVAAMTAALSSELATAGVLVNAVAPSVLDSKANREAMPNAPHGSWPTPDEVAAQIMWFISEENTAVRGAVLPVYGAMGEE